MNMNRLATSKNPYQGEYKRVLCVCSGGLLRSPTIAWVLSNPPFNFNTRAVGAVEEYALIPVDPVLIEWADEIVCADKDHVSAITPLVKQSSRPTKPVHCLHIEDTFSMRESALIERIIEALKGTSLTASFK